MGWEAITAVGTLVTALVIAITAVVGIRQLAELRRATMFDGTNRIVEQMRTPEMRAVFKYVVEELPERLKDPEYRIALLKREPLDPQKHPEQVLLEALEEIGGYVRYELLDTQAVLCMTSSYVTSRWNAIREVIKLRQQAFDSPYVWDNAEKLYEAILGHERYEERHNPKPRPSTGEPYRFE